MKLFGNERYRSLYFKGKFKLFYYAVFKKIGGFRRDDALRMGPELEKTVAETRGRIADARQQYRLPMSNDVLA